MQTHVRCLAPVFWAESKTDLDPLGCSPIVLTDVRPLFFGGLVPWCRSLYPYTFYDKPRATLSCFLSLEPRALASFLGETTQRVSFVPPSILPE